MIHEGDLVYSFHFLDRMMGWGLEWRRIRLSPSVLPKENQQRKPELKSELSCDPIVTSLAGLCTALSEEIQAASKNATQLSFSVNGPGSHNCKSQWLLLLCNGEDLRWFLSPGESQ